jgi:hypothetical protein
VVAIANTLGVASVEEEIRPVARVGLVVIGESGLTGMLVGHAVGALVVGGAAGGVGVDAESEFAAGSVDGVHCMINNF